MNEAVRVAFNEQIKNELGSGYLYLSMSAHLDYENLPGFAHWMRLQAEEELAHAMRLFDYTEPERRSSSNATDGGGFFTK